MPMVFRRLRVPDVILFEARAFNDKRGYFIEVFKESYFREIGVGSPVAQDNQSHSVKGSCSGDVPIAAGLNP